MCNGQVADGCDIMNLAEFETTLNNRIAKLDDHTTSPRISYDENFMRLQTHIENLDTIIPEDEPQLEAFETVETMSITESKRAIVCKSFSDDNKYVFISSCKRSVKLLVMEGNGYGYCFLNHPKIEKNQILKWSLRVPKFKRGWIGMVIILE